MSKTFPTDWKRSYWPEPRLSRARETRAAVVRRVRGAKREELAEEKAKRLQAALLED